MNLSLEHIIAARLKSGVASPEVIMCSRVDLVGQKVSLENNVILKGILMVYNKGVYGSDKREPIWLIWQLVSYGLEGASKAQAQVDRHN